MAHARRERGRFRCERTVTVAAVDSRVQASGPVGTRRPKVAWPVRSGAAPALAGGFSARPETAPGVAAALIPGAVVALVPGEAAAEPRTGSPDTACGKTQLAAYAAESLWRAGDVDLLIWVAATGRASALSGFLAAAAATGSDHVGDAESVAASFAAWLGQTSHRWLVVLDDLRDAADLEGFWPAGPTGRVLITTANPGRRVQHPRGPQLPDGAPDRGSGPAPRRH
jgi:hypothetical protein